MKYRAQFIRTEKVQYFVEVDSEVDMASASQKAYEIFNNADLDSLEHYYLDASDYMSEIKREEV